MVEYEGGAEGEIQEGRLEIGVRKKPGKGERFSKRRDDKREERAQWSGIFESSGGGFPYETSQGGQGVEGIGNEEGSCAAG